MKRDKTRSRAWFLPFLLCGAMGSGAALAGSVEIAGTLGPDSTLNYDNQVLSSKYCDKGDCELSYVVELALDGQKSIIDILLTITNDKDPDVRIEYALTENHDIELYDAVVSDQLSLSYIRTSNHTLDIRLRGSEGTAYNLQLSTLSTAPLPATAWLLLSAIGGASWLRGRRRRPATKSA